MPRPLLIVNQPDDFIQIFDTNSHSELQIVLTQISWLLHKQTDLDLHGLQKHGKSGSAEPGLRLS